MSWRTKIGRRLAWGYETASDGQWQRDGRIRRFMPTWTYRHGLLVVGLILFARWYWLGVVVRLHGSRPCCSCPSLPRPDGNDDRRQMMDLLTRIEASLEFMNDGGPIRVDFVNLREVLEGSREALLKLDEYEHRVEELESQLDQCLRIVREYVSSELADDPSQDDPSCELYPLIELVRKRT